MFFQINGIKLHIFLISTYITQHFFVNLPYNEIMHNQTKTNHKHYEKDVIFKLDGSHDTGIMQ